MATGESPIAAHGSGTFDLLRDIVAWGAEVGRRAEEFEQLVRADRLLGDQYITTYLAVIAENAGDLYGDARATATDLGLGYIPPPEKIKEPV